MEDQSREQLNHAMKWGFILGLTNIVFYLLAYIINKEIMVSMWFGLLSMAINITIMIIPVLLRRKETDGLITFNNAFLICFIVIAGGALLQSLFNFILYNLIDTGLSEFIKQKSLESTTAMMEKWGAPQESIDKAIENIQQTDFTQNPARIGKQYFFIVLFGAFLSLIIAAIFKKNKKITDFE